MTSLHTPSTLKKKNLTTLINNIVSKVTQGSNE